VANKVLTVLMIVRKVAFHELLKLFVILKVDSVPELGLALVEKIDAVKVHILFVPPEHCSPGAHIHVRISYSWDFLLSKALAACINVSEREGKTYSRMVFNSERFQGTFSSKRLPDTSEP
jgi:hypothetical protein